MAEEIDDITFIDTVKSPFLKQGITFREIVLRQIAKIAFLSSQEFKGGYTTLIMGRDGKMVEKYIPDAQEEYCQAVETLHKLVGWDYGKDPKIEKQIFSLLKKYKEEEKKLYRALLDGKLKEGTKEEEQKIKLLKYNKRIIYDEIFWHLHSFVQRHVIDEIPESYTQDTAE